MRKLFVLIFLPVLLGACRKDTPEDVKFSVSADQLTVKVNTLLSFNFENTPEIITFYSGEKGKEYRYKDRTTLPGKIELKFSTYVLNGLEKNLSLLVSTDLRYPVTDASIRNAKWTDITDRAAISTGKDNTPSGTIDLSEFNSDGAILSIAFKYTDVKRSSSQSTVYVRDILLNKIAGDGSVTKLMDLADGKWQAVNFANSMAVWSINTTRLYITGGNAASEANEDWVISRMVDLNNVNRDAGVPVKSITENKKSFEYTYATPGTYTATFVGANNYLSQSKSKVQEFTITVNP